MVNQSHDQYLETTLTAGNQVEITSGGDTHLEGGQVFGEQITAEVGGDLSIISQQDQEHYRKEQDSWGLNVGIGIGAAPISVSANYSELDANSNYVAVQEQSGLFAGDGGFDVNVGGNTHLEGAAIVSSADSDQNTFSTNTLTYDTIENHAAYDIESNSVSFSTGSPTSISGGSFYSEDDIAAALRAMNNGHFGESPNSNIIIRLDSPEFAAQSDGWGEFSETSPAYGSIIYDGGGEWVNVGGNVYVQIVPSQINPDLANFVRDYTGGEESPYSLPPAPPPSSDPIIQSSWGGRVLDKNGQYTLSLTVEGKPFVLRAWPCDISTAGCSGAVLDTSSRDYVAFQEAVNAKLLSDLSETGGGAATVIPAGTVATAVAISSEIAGLYANFMKDRTVRGGVETGTQQAFIWYLEKHGIPSGFATQFANGINVLGGLNLL